jgi:hypothetical protein
MAAEKNPFKADQFNLTQQGIIEREDHDKAVRLAAEADIYNANLKREANKKEIRMSKFNDMKYADKLAHIQRGYKVING